MERDRKRLKFEVLLERLFTNFHRVLLANLIFAVPSLIIFFGIYYLNVALFQGIFMPVFLLSIILVFPFYSGVVMVCRNIARGDSDVKVFKTYFTALRLNFLQFILHGVLVYAAVMLSYLSISLYLSMLGLSWVFYGLLFVCILISLFMLYTAFYIPLMSITYDLPLKYVYKNSFLMSFGEFKNNIFATIAMAVVFAICFTITAFAGNETVLIIMLVALWSLIVPAVATFMYVFFIYDGMVNIIRDKDELSRELTDSINRSITEARIKSDFTVEAEDFSDIDISKLKDSDDYIFHNGRMVKQSVLLRQIEEQKKQKESENG